MGGSVSRLEIELNHGKTELEPIVAGSVLSGKVHVEMAKEILQPPTLTLRLRFYGKEKVRMNRQKARRTIGNDGSRAQKHAERQILDVRLQWPNFPTPGSSSSSSNPDRRPIPVGEYVFPFAIKLPSVLPSSTYFPQTENRARQKMRFRIQYKLVASVVVIADGSSSSSTGAGGGDAASEKCLSTATKYVWIQAAAPHPPPEPIPIMIEPVVHPLRGGVGIFTSNKKGTLLFGAKIDNSQIMDRVIHLHVSCRNDSSVDINSISVKVLEILKWGTAAINHVDETSGARKTSSTLQQESHIILASLSNVQLPGLAKESKGFWNRAVHALVGTDQVQSYQRQVYDDIISNENLMEIPISARCRESYAGQLLTISHVVQISFETHVKTPRLEIPISILSEASPTVDAGGSTSSTPTGAGQAYYVPKQPMPEATTGLAPDENNILGSGPQLPSGSKGGDGIPMAAATVIPANKSSVDNSDSVIVLGGDAILRADRRSLRDLVPLAAPIQQVSLQGLRAEMNSSINDYELLSDRLLKREWLDLIQKLTPEEFGSVISCVSNELDQVRVALLLAPNLRPQLTSAHAAAAIRHTQQRAVMAQRLVPLTSDSNVHLIRNELSDWEQTVAADVLERAAKR